MGTESLAGAQATTGFRYLRLADNLEEEIRQGVYRAGDKLPAIRTMHARAGVSITTVCQAYGELEKRGLVEPRSRSGYYIKAGGRELLPLPTVHRGRVGPVRVAVNVLAEALQETMDDDAMLPLAAVVPGADVLPLRQLAGSMRTVTARYPNGNGFAYGPPGGLLSLRRQIAKRMADCGVAGGADEVVITSGCMEAISLCLRAVAGPGDTVLVESPTFVCYLQLIEDLNMMALEIPADPEQGVDLDALEQAVAEHGARAAIVNPNFQNPLGFEMAAADKERLVSFLAARRIPLIEDDIYGELHFGRSRPTLLKALDRDGLVLYCSSFSKALAPDLRVGWTMPGRFIDRVRRLKFNSTIAAPKLNQLIIDDFLQNGHFDRHLRRMRSTMRNRVDNLARLVARFFPAGTKISAPRGGYILWVELPGGADGFELFHRARAAGIAILPGEICSGSGRHRNCIRLCGSLPWSEELERGVATLGGIVAELAGGAGGLRPAGG